MVNTSLIISLGNRSTLVDIGGLPNVKMLRFKFNMPGCGCAYHFKAFLNTNFDEVSQSKGEKDVKDFMKLFLLGSKYKVNFCAQCGTKLPDMEGSK